MTKKDEQIRSIAATVRKIVERECGGKTRGLCNWASELLSQRLSASGIDNDVLYGDWAGPSKKRYRDWGHTWVELDDGRIVDITADQFGKDFPQVWFPADEEHYYYAPKTHPDKHARLPGTVLKTLRSRDVRRQAWTGVRVHINSYRRRHR